ncbi:DNA glycosylase/AP lyase ROS1 [Trifolium repens]|nr:DNA glycosylase/AP lyase ROS1 [Trifolium repens]
MEVHPYASNYNSWMYGSGFNTAVLPMINGSGYNTAVLPMINEYTENYIHNTQTFDEFRLSLRRVTDRSQFEAQTCEYNSHYNSLMRIRSCIEPDYTAKQQEFSD